MMISIDDLSYLPKSMHELARIAGWPATLIIIEQRGGTRLCIPTDAKEDHWLMPLIGKEALQKIAGQYRGEEIDIPRCAAAIHAIKMQIIGNEIASGKSSAAIARQYGYTERGIRLIRRRLEAGAYGKQIQEKLF